MPLIDAINRQGQSATSVITGPSQLGRLSSNANFRKDYAATLGASVDEYEIRTAPGSGTGGGTYIVSIKPLGRGGFTPRLRGVTGATLVRQIAGIATPTNPRLVVGTRRFSTDRTTLIMPTIVCTAGDRLWIYVGTKRSDTAYRLEVDFT